MFESKFPSARQIVLAIGGEVLDESIKDESEQTPNASGDDRDGGGFLTACIPFNAGKTIPGALAWLAHSSKTAFPITVANDVTRSTGLVLVREPLLRSVIRDLGGDENEALSVLTGADHAFRVIFKPQTDTVLRGYAEACTLTGKTVVGWGKAWAYRDVIVVESVELGEAPEGAKFVWRINGGDWGTTDDTTIKRLTTKEGDWVASVIVPEGDVADIAVRMDANVGEQALDGVAVFPTGRRKFPAFARLDVGPKPETDVIAVCVRKISE